MNRAHVLATIAVMACCTAGANADQSVASTPVDRVADALAAGEAAETGRAAEALVSAARRLDRLSARPADGQDDLAVRWRTRGASLGAVDNAPPLRGRALGPAYRGGQLGGGTRIDIDQIFMAGQKAEVVVVPQQGRSLEIRVSDVERSEVCGQTVKPPKAACRWTPIFTSRFRISVSNPAPTAARYYIVSN